MLSGRGRSINLSNCVDLDLNLSREISNESSNILLPKVHALDQLKVIPVPQDAVILDFNCESALGCIKGSEY
jgi:hypothetical protein